jgi:hypothetical protein
MRKLPRVSGTAAAVLAVTVTAGGLTCRPATGSATGARAAQLTTSSRLTALAPAARFAAATADRGPAGIRPGGTAILARGQHLPAGAGLSTSDLTSLNWGGYAASRPGLRFRYVQATFFVPYVDCASTPNAQSAHWAGLDGLHNSTVEQAGISADCLGSTPSYRAWYELVPMPPVFQHITIKPGDSIVARVYFSRRRSTFTLSLTDATNGHHFSHTAPCPSRATCQRSDAEVISEPPLGPGGYLPLANFRAQGYSSAQVTDQQGHRGGLRSSRWDTTKITTVSQRGAVLDQPTALYRATAFGMYWMREK